MVKKILSFAIAVLFLSSSVAFAKVGGPIRPVGKHKIALSLESEYIAEQKLGDATKLNTHQFPAGNGTRVINDINTGSKDTGTMKMARYFLKTNLGLLDNLDFFFKLGSSRMKVKDHNYSDSTAFGLGSGTYDFVMSGRYGFSWSAGFNAKVVSIKKWFDIGLSADYLHHRTKIHEMAESSNLIAVRVYTSSLSYREWNVAAYFSKKMSIFTPYAGLKYKDSEFKQKVSFVVGVNAAGNDMNNDTKIKYEPPKHLVMFLGSDFEINKHWSANIEAAYFAEQAISASVTYKF